MEAIGLTLDKDLFYYLDHGGEHSEVSRLQVNKVIHHRTASNFACNLMHLDHMYQVYWGRRFHIPMQILYGTA
jgi:hypothetical protein